MPTSLLVGAKAFFPNDQTRKEQLLRMLKDINVSMHALCLLLHVVQQLRVLICCHVNSVLSIDVYLFGA